jgi:G3E family GTPase
METTGLADFAPVIQTFFVDEDMQGQLALDAVVTVVDAKHIWSHWESKVVKRRSKLHLQM